MIPREHSIDILPTWGPRSVGVTLGQGRLQHRKLSHPQFLWFPLQVGPISPDHRIFPCWKKYSKVCCHRYFRTALFSFVSPLLLCALLPMAHDCPFFASSTELEALRAEISELKGAPSKSIQDQFVPADVSSFSVPSPSPGRSPAVAVGHHRRHVSASQSASPAQGIGSRPPAPPSQGRTQSLEPPPVIPYPQIPQTSAPMGAEAMDPVMVQLQQRLAMTNQMIMQQEREVCMSDWQRRNSLRPMHSFTPILNVFSFYSCRTQLSWKRWKPSC